MLKFNVNITDSVERPVAAGYTVSAEGQALVADTTDGVFGVKPSTGASGEKFAGVALSQQLTLEYLPIVEEFVVAEDEITVTLSHTPVGGTLRVLGNGSALAVGTPAGDATKYSISGSVITVNTALKGKSVVVAYRYAPTVIEAKTIQGDIPPGGAASLTLNSVGVIRRGDIFTSEYDTSVDWTGDPDVALGANGLFTVGGSGTEINAVVIQVPSATDPFLGLELRG